MIGIIHAVKTRLTNPIILQAVTPPPAVGPAIKSGLRDAFTLAVGATASGVVLHNLYGTSSVNDKVLEKVVSDQMGIEKTVAEQKIVLEKFIAEHEALAPKLSFDNTEAVISWVEKYKIAEAKKSITSINGTVAPTASPAPTDVTTLEEAREKLRALSKAINPAAESFQAGNGRVAPSIIEHFDDQQGGLSWLDSVDKYMFIMASLVLFAIVL